MYGCVGGVNWPVFAYCCGQVWRVGGAAGCAQPWMVLRGSNAMVSSSPHVGPDDVERAHRDREQTAQSLVRREAHADLLAARARGLAPGERVLRDQAEPEQE